MMVKMLFLFEVVTHVNMLSLFTTKQQLHNLYLIFMICY
jgi:hypothetical protein